MSQPTIEGTMRAIKAIAEAVPLFDRAHTHLKHLDDAMRRGDSSQQAAAATTARAALTELRRHVARIDV